MISNRKQEAAFCQNLNTQQWSKKEICLIWRAQFWNHEQNKNC